MLAMVLEFPRAPLVATERPVPAPGPGQVRVRVSACAVCRTDLHVIDDELPNVPHPIVPGHEIVGVVDAIGAGATLPLGTRVGIPWLAHTCGRCEFCSRGEENLCGKARFTGYHVDGGYAEYVVAEQDYCLRLPADLDDLHAAPLLCAGLIGYRSLTMTGARAASVSTGSAPRLISSRRSPASRAVSATLSCGRATTQPRSLRASSAVCGRVAATHRRP